MRVVLHFKGAASHRCTVLWSRSFELIYYLIHIHTVKLNSSWKIRLCKHRKQRTCYDRNYKITNQKYHSYGVNFITELTRGIFYTDQPFCKLNIYTKHSQRQKQTATKNTSDSNETNREFAVNSIHNVCNWLWQHLRLNSLKPVGPATSGHWLCGGDKDLP